MERRVATRRIQKAVRGHETKVLKILNIAGDESAKHRTCPYPGHADEHPSWRWDGKKQRAYCTCIDGSHTIFDVVMRCENIDFERAKLRVAEILGRHDLIEARQGECYQTTDAASLLRPPADQRDDDLLRSYLGHRLGVAAADVPLPSTPAVGWRDLPYYDAPLNKGEKPKLVRRHPCVVFATLAPDGREHAHRIYTAAGGAGKADVGVRPDGHRRDSKKSAKLQPGQSSAGCVVLWGDPTRAPHLFLCEGIETAAALAFAHLAEIKAGGVAVAAALSTGGIRAFVPWPATGIVIVAADRDEAKPEGDRAFKAGERAAREFARKHHQRLEIRIALPGLPGVDADWLDILRAEGIEAVRAGIATAPAFMPPAQEAAGPGAEAGSPDPEQIERDLIELVERAKADPGAPFEREAVVVLASARHGAPAAYQRAIRGLKEAGARMRDLDREIRRANLRVIEGGGASSGFEATIEAGPYFVTREGMTAWRKKTREGVVPQLLCNFTARIVAEEVLDDGAEQRTVFVVEGELQGGRSLSATRVPAERYPAMGWVTESWGMAPVILAGQGKRDHLRAAIQMLSGAVPRHTVYGHLGWRRIGDGWAFLHTGGAIGAAGALDEVEVDTGHDGFLPYQLPAPSTGKELAEAVRASLGLLELGPETTTAPVLGAVYRAPLGEPSPADFSLHLTGPTGSFKTELAALAQAHFGPAFNGRRLPGSWADTANMLEKKAFLAKDAVLVVDDFAPTGTSADIQRVHREADRLFRAAGNRSGRARMRADGGSRPTYFPRGLIISTGEDIPSGQSLQARLLVLELTPGEIPASALSAAQSAAAEGLFAAAMAGYLLWLGPQMDHLKETLPGRQRALRDSLAQDCQHRRTPDLAASLILSWEMLLRFAQEVSAVGRDEAAGTLSRVRAALTDSAQAQCAHQVSEEPAIRFLALLRAALSSGRAHVAEADTGLEPQNANCWGWQLNVPESGDYDREAWRAKGERLGWIRDEELLLDPEAAFAAAQKLARDQGTSIPIKQRTLWKRLAEQGLLASRDLARGTNTVRRTIQGLRRDLLHLRTSTLAAQTDQRGDETDQRAETDQEKGPQRRGFPGPGQFGQFGQKIEPRGPSKRDLRDAVGWEVEI